MVHAHCFYVDARTFNGVPVWQITDFAIWLTKQQPTHWVASQGRAVNPTDGYGNDGSGLDPGAIPPVPDGFTGELKCIQVDASGTPVRRQQPQGRGADPRDDGDVSKHNAIAILANPDLAGGDPAHELRLDNSRVNDGEYNACPQTTLLNHFVDGATDPVIDEFNPELVLRRDDCPIRTYLTLVPCTQDFENANFASVTVQFSIVNEFEETFSASTTVDCWATFRLADVDAPTGSCTKTDARCVSDQQCIDADDGFCDKNSVFSLGNLGTSAAFTRITPVALDGGVLTVAEEVHYNNLASGGDQVTQRAWAAWNPQAIGNRYDATDPNQGGPPGGPVVDIITVPDLF